MRSKRNRRTNHQPKLPRAIIEKAIKSFVGPHTLENSLKLALYGPILRINFYPQVNISHCSHCTLLHVYLKSVTKKTVKIVYQKINTRQKSSFSVKFVIDNLTTNESQNVYKIYRYVFDTYYF